MLALPVTAQDTTKDKAGPDDNKPPEGFTALQRQGPHQLAGPHRGLAAREDDRGATRQKAQKAANEKFLPHWTVVDGILTYDGKGQSLQTVKDYKNYELHCDWKIPPKGDSGIYLHGYPQVQIWDRPRPRSRPRRTRCGSAWLACVFLPCAAARFFGECSAVHPAAAIAAGGRTLAGRSDAILSACGVILRRQRSLAGEEEVADRRVGLEADGAGVGRARLPGAPAAGEEVGAGGPVGLVAGEARVGGAGVERGEAGGGAVAPRRRRGRGSSPPPARAPAPAARRRAG